MLQREPIGQDRRYSVVLGDNEMMDECTGPGAGVVVMLVVGEKVAVVVMVVRQSWSGNGAGNTVIGGLAV